MERAIVNIYEMSNPKNEDIETFEIGNAFPHHQFDPVTIANDIMIIKVLDSIITLVDPVRLNSDPNFLTNRQQMVSL
jgi:hypothetical protein